MVRPAAIVLLLSLFLVSPLPCSSETRSDPAIRALRGPFSPSGLPPFAVTSFVLLCTGSLVWYRRRKSVRTPAPPEQLNTPVSPRDLLALLLEEARFRQRDPAEIVERLTLILHNHLAGKSHVSAEHSTSQELITGLQRTGEAGLLPQASRLLDLCDNVRFGGLVPTFEQTERALQETLLLIDNHNESISYNAINNVFDCLPPFQGEGRGGDGVDCCIPAHKQDLNQPHPHPNLPLEGEGTKDFGKPS